MVAAEAIKNLFLGDWLVQYRAVNESFGRCW